MADSPQTRAFFDLPRELRDEIYTHYHNAIPRGSGALRGYTDTPSSALLRTCKQVHREAATHFRLGLKAALLHERVCIQLRDKDAEGIVRHAGWTRMSAERFNIWVRAGPEDDSEIGWCYDIHHIWQGGVCEDADKGVGDEILALSAKLKKLSHIFANERFELIGKRIYSVYSRVSQVAARIVEKDVSIQQHSSEEAKGTLKERQSQPSDMQVASSTMRMVPRMLVLTRMGLGNGEQD